MGKLQNIWKDILDNKEIIVVLTFIWIVLYETFSPFVLITGIVCSILVVLFTDQFLLKGNYEHSYIIGLGTLLKYAFRLIIEIYLAGIDILPTIIKGNEEVEIVEVETKLNDELLIDILANSITLTPGTVTVDKKGKKLFILNLNAQSPGEDRRELLPLRLEDILIEYEEKIEGKA